MTSNRLLTPTEAAAYLGVSKTTLFRRTAEKRIKRVRMGPQTVRYETDELDRFVRANRED